MISLNKKYLLSLLIAINLIAMSCSEKETQDLFFFYFESCPSCDDYKLAEKFNKKLDLLNKSGDWNARYYNLINVESGKELKNVLAEKGLPDVSRSLPLLIIGEDYINGYDNIQEQLDTFLSEK